MATAAPGGQEQKLHGFLTSLSESRQAVLPESARNTYVRQLRGYDIQHVARAISQMITEPREAFQSAFPDLGTIIRRVEAVRDEQNRRPKHVACGMNGCKGGWLIIRDEKYSYAAECDCLKRWRRGEQVALPDPISEHLREVQAHPERFVPVDLCVRVGEDLGRAKLERARKGKPMTDGEYRDLKKKLTAEMNRKWLEQLANGHNVVAQ